MQEVMDLTRVSNTFPAFPYDLIPMDNLLETIDNTFQVYNEEVVVIEGEYGSGKTALTKQFCDKYYNNAISLFVKPSSKFTYDPKIIKTELYNQIHWIMYEKEIKEIEEIDESQINMLFLRFNRYLKNRNDLYYIVIDGLEDISESENYLLEIILEILPFGLNNNKVKFLISSNNKNRITNFFTKKKIKFKPFMIPGFSNEQATKFFNGFEISDSDIEEIRKICKGKPGDLFTVKRTLETGISVEDLLNEMHDKLPGLFAYEWFLLDKQNEKLMELLAILAHEPKNNKIRFISQLLNLTEEEVIDLCKPISFINLDNDKSQISFYSETYRKFIAKKLSDKENYVKNVIIKHLLSETDDENILFLPAYLNEAGELDELVNVLNPDLFSKLLYKTQSLGALSRMAHLGLSASSQLKKDEEHFRFGMQSSLIMENYTTKIWESEIKALISLDEYDKAMVLTQSNALIEDRLHMLAIIARRKKEQGLTPDSEITESINTLCDSIDFNSLGEKALNIAEELIYTNTELAIEIIEKTSGNSQGENALDYAFAKIALSTMNGSKSQITDSETFESLNSKIKNPKMRSFFDDFSLFLKNSSAKDLLVQVRNYESASDQLYILSNWCAATTNIESIHEVIEYALNLTIQTTEYAPNAGVYRKLSTKIPDLTNSGEIIKIVNLFESQIDNIEKIGPTDDYILIQLNLAKAISKYDYELCSEKLVDLYLYINNLEDISIKTDGYANLFADLLELDVEKRLETEHGLHTLVNEDLDTCINELLIGSANHGDGFKGTINALSKGSPTKTLKIIERLNTSATRENGYIQFIKSYINQKIDASSITLISDIISKITDIDLFSEAVLSVIEGLYFTEEEYDESYIKMFIEIFNRIRDISEPNLRCKGICLTYMLIKNVDELSQFRESLLSELRATWESIDIGWRRVDIGFNIIQALSSGSIEVAREFLKEIEDFRNDLVLYDPNISWSYLHVIRLAIRSYSGLLSNDIDNDRDLEQISSLIEVVPSNGEKAILWSELALRFFMNQKIDKGKKLVFDKIKPCINKISDRDFRYKIHVLTKVAPTLFTAHKSTSYELLESLPDTERDLSYYYIAQFIFTQTPPSDPYAGTQGHGYDINYEDVIDLCELIEKVDKDNLIFFLITDISDSVQQNRRFTIQQKLDVANRLEKLIQSKLPNKKHIQHDGYKIVCLAQVYKLKQTKTQEWLNLTNSARLIPNKSDKAYVLTIVASNFPKNKQEKIWEIIQEADEITDTLPTTSDKITQYEALAVNLMKIDQVKSKGFIKKAMDLSLTKDDQSNAFTLQKRLIDLAHRLDPDFAQSLVSINDKDPARRKMKNELEEELEMLELRNKMADSSEKTDDNKPAAESYVKAAWKLLGGLHSGRVGTVHFEKLRDYIDDCANLPLMEAFPIYSWLIENSNIRFKQDASRASQIIRPIFESILYGADFSLLMSGNSKIQINKARNNVLSNSYTSILIKADEREKALDYLKEWFESQATNYVKICDPYFGVQDLNILQLFRVIKPEIRYEVLTSIKNQKQEGIKGNYEEEFMKYWRLNISDQNPPEAEIAIVGKKSDGELPIHDRWIFTEGSGLRLGISYKSLGMKKDSEISILSTDEKELLEEDVNKYLTRSTREYDGEKLVYNTFPL